MANLAGKQKLILLYLTNCSCCTFFLPASSLFPLVRNLALAMLRSLFEMMAKKNGSDTCGRNYITINICAHLSIISDVQHHRPGIHKILLWRELRIFFLVDFPPLFFLSGFLFWCSPRITPVRDMFKHSLIEMMKQIISTMLGRGRVSAPSAYLTANTRFIIRADVY